MRIASGVTDQFIYFVALDATDLRTRETGLSTFTVYRSRNGGVATAMTTPTINETDSTNMPGVYELLLDEDMTIDTGDETQEMAFHITHAGMAAVTRTIELYRPKITVGRALDVTAGGAAGIDWGNVENITTSNNFTNTTIGTVTTNTDMRGTDNALLAASYTAPDNASISAILVDTGTTLPAQITSEVNDVQADIAALNNISAAQVNAEVDTALTDIGLDHLLSTSVTGTDVANNSLFARIASSAATADFDTFNNTTDSLQAIRDKQADIETDTQDIQTQIGTAGAGLTAIPWNSAWDAEVQSEVNDALVAVHLDHLFAVDYNPAAKPGVATALLNEIIESDAGVSRFTANALEEAPTGGSAPTPGEIADAVWDELTAGHTTAGTFGEQVKTDIDAILADTNELQTDNIPGLIAALNDPTAGAVADAVWNAAIAAHNTAGTFGATNQNLVPSETIADYRADVSGLATAASLATVDTNVDAILVDTGTTIPAQITSEINDVQADIAALNNISAAQVNAEVVDVLTVDTQILPGQGAPTATPTIAEAITYLFKDWRNRKDTTSTQWQLYADDGTTVDQKATVSDTAGTFTKQEIESGP